MLVLPSNVIIYIRTNPIACQFYVLDIFIWFLANKVTLFAVRRTPVGQFKVAWFTSPCLGRRLSTWPTTAVSCPTALGALCGQLTFWLARCRKHSGVMATELLQPWDLTCGILFQSSCVIQTSPLHYSDDSWRDTWTRRSVTSDMWCYRKTLTYLPRSYQ